MLAITLENAPALLPALAQAKGRTIDISQCADGSWTFTVDGRPTLLYLVSEAAAQRAACRLLLDRTRAGSLEKFLTRGKLAQSGEPRAES